MSTTSHERLSVNAIYSMAPSDRSIVLNLHNIFNAGSRRLDKPRHHRHEFGNVGLQVIFEDRIRRTSAKGMRGYMEEFSRCVYNES